MKIRTQVYILLFGILLIPLIVFCAMTSVSYLRSPERLLVPGYKAAQLFADSDLPELDDDAKKKITSFITNLPPAVEVLVLTGERKVLYSDFSEIASGSLLTPDDMANIFDTGRGRYVFQVDSHFGKRFSRSHSNRSDQFGRGGNRNHGNLMVITRVSRDFRKKPNRYDILFKSAVIVLIILFAFCATVITAIVRSITRSVMLLDHATRRIAEGNFDDAVDVKGSNEITSLAHSFNTMRESLKEAHIRRSRFIMGVSHDLRTPLALIKGYTEAIVDGIADSAEMRKRSLEIVGTKIDQLEDLIDDLINFVKLDTGEWRSNLEPHLLKPLLDDYASRITGDGNLLGRTVVSRIDIPETLEIALDERLFIRALENLCGNALRYTDSGGTVRLDAELIPATENEAQTVRICISDNGFGIPQEDLPYVFDPFYRGSNSRREDGKGLGLAVVKSVIDSHGWNIAVESEKGKGSAFTIFLPS